MRSEKECLKINVATSIDIKKINRANVPPGLVLVLWVEIESLKTNGT